MHKKRFSLPTHDNDTAAMRRANTANAAASASSPRRWATVVAPAPAAVVVVANGVEMVKLPPAPQQASACECDAEQQQQFSMSNLSAEKADDNSAAAAQDEKDASSCFARFSPMHAIARWRAGVARAGRSSDTPFACSLFKPSVWLVVFLAVGYHVFLATALHHDFKKSSNLFTVTVIVWACAVYCLLLRPVYARYAALQKLRRKCMLSVRQIATNWGIQCILYAAVPVGVAAFIIWDAWGSYQRLTGLVGMGCFFLLMCICSSTPTKINWRPVLWGFMLQFLFGIAVLRWEWGSARFTDLSETITTFLGFAKNGTDFVYGFLSAPPNICGMNPVLAFQTLQVIVYFGAVVALLYFYGVIQAVLKRMAWLMQATLATTAPESLNACACVLLGNAEAPMLIRPYLERMTASELHAIMSTGFACASGAMFAAYISFGACPRYLLSAAIMSAPGSLACSKLLYPETEQSHCRTYEELELTASEEENPLEAISNGAILGAHLVLTVVANVLVFMALISLADGILGYFGGLVGQPGWTIEMGLSYAFFPVAYVMGVTASTSETLIVARLLGVKLIVNDFIAYKMLGESIAQNALSPHSAMIATYSLCSFSHFISAGIQLAVLGGMAPSKKKLLSRIVLRALLAGFITCLMSASLAGVLVSEPIVCRPTGVQSTPGCINIDDLFQLKAALTNASFSSVINKQH